jgi:hypothetical protein
LIGRRQHSKSPRGPGVRKGYRTTEGYRRRLLWAGRENVRRVSLDMSDSYRSFARSFLPNARLVADNHRVSRAAEPAPSVASAALR